jgi:hypothetical protein
MSQKIVMPQSRCKVWRLLNSPSAIWCLSSVILAVVTTGWTLLHAWLLECRREREKRTALAFEISVRATDFLVKCHQSQSPGELWWHFDEFEQAQKHLTQFSAATMDELIFQYGLLSGKQDAVVAKALESATTNLYSTLNGFDRLDLVEKRLDDIVNKQVIDTVRQDAETNGKLLAANHSGRLLLGGR